MRIQSIWCPASWASWEKNARWAAGERDLSHDQLDRLEQTPVLAHLRSVLVATGTLPPRDEQMARLERFAGEVIDSRRDAASTYSNSAPSWGPLFR
jgi:hypothetical protein